MTNLLVDDAERARQNRERVAAGYCNKGYDIEAASMRNSPLYREPNVDSILPTILGHCRTVSLARDRERVLWL